MNIQQSNNVAIQLGKKGITDEFIVDLKKNLNKDKLVKVKFLKASLEGSSRQEISSNLLDRLNIINLSFESKMVGNTLFLKRVRK
ncbi:MAG: YhbY family RNA-binding protein [Candidatus Woesearchaeota archaeon]